MSASRAATLAAIASLLCPSPCLAKSSKTISVALDPRIELAGLAQSLCPEASDPKGFTRRRLVYFDELQKNPGLRPPCAASLKAFGFSDRRQVLLRLSPPPELAVRIPLPYAFYDRAGGKEALERWLLQLRDFARDSGFMVSFNSAQALLEPQVEAFRGEIAKIDYLDKLESYTGLELIGRYSIYPSAFDAPGGVANNVAELPDGSMEITSLIGAQEISGSSVTFWSRRVPGIIWHEVGHGIEDALADLYSDDVRLSSAALSSLGENCYGDSLQCVKEHVVRAVMIRLIAREIGPEAAEEQLRFEDERRFPYLKPMLERLREYEILRKRYPSLADFYPELLAVLPASATARRRFGFSASMMADPKKARLSRTLGQLRSKTKNPAQLADIRKAQEALKESKDSADPSSRIEDDAPRSSARRRGIEHYRLGDLEMALRDFDLSLAAEPPDAEILLDRAVVLQSLHRFDEAIESYQRAISAAEPQQRPNEILLSALSSRASLWIELKRRDLARADLERAIALAPDDWPLLEETRQLLKELHSH